MLAAASIPLGGIQFTGTVGFLLRGNREYRFATYLGASVKKMDDAELIIRQGRFRLRVRFSHPGGRALRAPVGGKMARRVKEDIACGAEYTLTYDNRVLLRTVTDKAAAEFEATRSWQHERRCPRLYLSIR